MARRMKWYSWCDIGNHRIEKNEEGKRPSRHVFPVPVCRAFPNGNEGRPNRGVTACLEHYPGAYRLQKKQKLVIPIAR